MINISFDNPYLLLLFIPMALLVLVPFLIAIRRENKSRETTFALICHLLIVALCVPAAAGMMNTTVITKTQVYVLADVSDSTNQKTDLMDGYITELKDQLPRNSQMGVITFGKDAKLHTPLGERFTTLQNSGTDGSATDILGALRYADSLFDADCIKRVVLYTDGFSTDPNATGDLIRVVEDMRARDIYIDVVYIDSNLEADAKEIQVSDVEFNASTYLGHENTANVLIESTVDAAAIVRLTKNGEAYLEQTADLTPGYNIVNFALDTAEAGEFDYQISVTVPGDQSQNNNSHSFTQKVNQSISVLLVTDRKTDVDIVKALYGESATIDARVKPKQASYGQKQELFDVPFTVEELCKYDQYILSNVDVAEVNNADTFIASMDTCVSMFGKSLITVGDNGLQNNDAPAIDALSNMLPVNFGNSEQDPKLYAIVVDTSRSMAHTYVEAFTMAKEAAKHMLGLLGEEDYFTLVHFSGEVYVPLPPRKASPENIKEATDIIDGFEVSQGTMIGKTLDRVNEIMGPYSYFNERQVMLISDGQSFEGGEQLDDDFKGAAERLLASNVTVSTLNVGVDMNNGVQNMQQIAASGGGKHYYAKSSADLNKVMFDEIADDVTDTVIIGSTPVIFNRPNDDVLEGIDALPNIGGFVYAKPKASAENILLVEYQKSGGSTVRVPLYAYWAYGNGRVATLTTDLGGEWVADWQEGAGLNFLHNLNTTNIPATKVDYPYTVDVTFDGKYTHIEIIPAFLNPDATMTVTVTAPDGSVLTQLLTFDSYRYFYKLQTDAVGKYVIDTTYDWITKSYTSSTVFNISYSPEYGKFHTYTPGALHAFMRNNGGVFEEGNAVLTTDPTRLDTYVIYFTVPFLAAAAVLYLIDTVIRKLKWADIKSFFKKRRKKKEAQ